MSNTQICSHRDATHDVVIRRSGNVNLKGTIVFTVVTAVCVGAASVIYLRWQEFAPMAGWVH